MPTASIPISAAADDGTVVRTSASYATIASGSANVDTTNTGWVTVGRYLSAGTFEVHVVVLRFQTAALLPDTATVTAARLKIHVLDAWEDDLRNVSADYYNSFTTLSTSDWVINDPSGDAISGIALSSLTDGGVVNTLTLSGLTGISTTSSTTIRMHISGGQPTAWNYLAFAPYGHATAPVPTLEVDYTLASTRLAPNLIVSRTNLPNVDGVAADDATALAALDEDPDSSGTDWLTV